MGHSVLVGMPFGHLGNHAEEASGEYHGDGEHGRKRHVCGGGVGEADHADGGGQQNEQPARGFGAVKPQRKPRECERGEERAKGAGQAGCGFADAKEFEDWSAAPQ